MPSRLTCESVLYVESLLFIILCTIIWHRSCLFHFSSLFFFPLLQITCCRRRSNVNVRPRVTSGNRYFFCFVLASSAIARWSMIALDDSCIGASKDIGNLGSSRNSIASDSRGPGRRPFTSAPVTNDACQRSLSTSACYKPSRPSPSLPFGFINIHIS